MSNLSYLVFESGLFRSSPSSRREKWQIALPDTLRVFLWEGGDSGRSPAQMLSRVVFCLQ